MARVLVVDDEDDIRALVRLNLEQDGHEVVSAASGPEALELIASDIPDVIVLDVMMPDLDGWEVLARIKADGVMSAIPVVMLTARTDDMDRLRGGIEGAIHYLTKPFSIATLRSTVREALEGDPEPVKRRRVQRGAMEQLARIDGAQPADPGAARPRLSRLEHTHETRAAPPPLPRVSKAQVATLSAKQQQLLDMLAVSPTVREAAEQLGVSRSNVYASLRRIARKLDVGSVPELVSLARHGELGSATPH
jgi:DNA-binding response OmpR family regulator